MMQIKKIIKWLCITIAGLVVVGAAVAYFSLRSMGFFRTPQYDTTPPTYPELTRPAVLVLHKTNGFVHKDGLPAASKMLTELSRDNGWSIYHTDNAASHTSQDLARFDLVVWNNTTGDILTQEQRAHFTAWLEAGGAWLGIHAAGGDRSYDWDWYRDSLIGAQFIGHTMSPQFQDAVILIADNSSLTKHIPQPWVVKQEEWYGFDRNPRQSGAKILLNLDESSYDTSERWFAETSMPGEHPIAWSRAIGKGKMIYSAIGHQAATYVEPNYRQFIANSMQELITVSQSANQ